MKKQLSIFDGTDETKEALAISLIKSFEGVSLERNPLGYVVGYSGGKDSEVLVDLFIKSGVKFIVVHNHTGLDAPETVYFIRKKFKQWREQGIDCRIYYPKKSFWALCNEKKMLPTRLQRFCCAELKERNDIPELKFATHSFGVRKTESSKRANNRDSIETRNTESFGKTFQKFHFDKADEVKQTSACYTNKYFIVNPIAYWTEEEVWQYIHENNIEYNPLYDKGFTRIGCIGCPVAGKHRIEEFKAYPKYKALYKKLSDKIEREMPNDNWKKNSNGKYKTFFEWWLQNEDSEAVEE